MTEPASIWYRRAGRKVRARGIVIERDLQGMAKVKPLNPKWGHIWITIQEQVAGGDETPVPSDNTIKAPPASAAVFELEDLSDDRPTSDSQKLYEALLALAIRPYLARPTNRTGVHPQEGERQMDSV